MSGAQKQAALQALHDRHAAELGGLRCGSRRTAKPRRMRCRRCC